MAGIRRYTATPFRKKEHILLLLIGYRRHKQRRGLPYWPSREDSDRQYHTLAHTLAARFTENFKLLRDGCPENVVLGAPVLAPAG